MLFATVLNSEKDLHTDGISKAIGEIVLPVYIFKQALLDDVINTNKRKIYNATDMQIKKLISNKISTIDLSKYEIKEVDCTPSKEKYNGSLRAWFRNYGSDKLVEISVQ